MAAKEHVFVIQFLTMAEKNHCKSVL